MLARRLIVLLIVVVVAAAAYWFLRPGGGSSGIPGGDTTHLKSKHGVAITVTTPTAGSTVTSPLNVRGVVPGSWSFEANFGVEILDANHKRVADGFATVTGDWMTEKPVPFTASVPFKAPVTNDGFVVLNKANPADDEGKADSVEIPVKFGP